MAWVLGPNRLYGKDDRQYAVLCDPHRPDEAVALTDYGLHVNSDGEIRGCTQEDAQIIQTAIDERVDQLRANRNSGGPLLELDWSEWYARPVAQLLEEQPHFRAQYGG